MTNKHNTREIMDDYNQMMKDISVLWRQHQKLQSLYQLAMTMDISLHLRKICNRGYMSSLLFKKEMLNIYEATKCYLKDGDLNSIVRASDADLYSKTDDLRDLLLTIQANLNKCVLQYQQISADFQLNENFTWMLEDHLEKLGEIGNLLEIELSKYKASPGKNMTAVA